MTQTNSVFWTLTAENDLLAIIGYIKISRPKAALIIFDNIKTAVSNLILSPEQGRLVPELLAQGINTYRELIVSPWRITYRLAEKRIYILAIIDGRRNVEDVLLDRLIRK